MKLVWWLLVALAVVVGVVMLWPSVSNIDWKKPIRTPSATHLSDETYGKVRNGMNVAEATAILGDPSQDHMGHMAGVGTVGNGSRFLIWSDGTMEVTVNFSQEGLVISKSRRWITSSR
jgi:hypothetical protein